MKMLTSFVFLAWVAASVHASDWPMDRFGIGRTADSGEALGLPLQLGFSASIFRDNTTRVANYGSVVVRTIGGSDYVYAVSLDGSLTAFSSKGAQLWRYATGGSIFGAAAVDTSGTIPTVVVASSDGKAYAINATSGSLLWKTGLGGPANGSPLVVNGKAIFVANSGQITALNFGDGSLAWQIQTGAYQWAGAASDGTNVYVSGDDGSVYSIAVTTGVQIWKVNLGGDQFRFIPAISGTHIYVPGQSGNLYCLDAGSGATIWTLATTDGYLTSPAVLTESGAARFVLASADGKIAKYQDNGTTVSAPMWTQNIGGKLYSSPSIASDYCDIKQGRIGWFWAICVPSKYRGPAIQLCL